MGTATDDCNFRFVQPLSFSRFAESGLDGHVYLFIKSGMQEIAILGSGTGKVVWLFTLFQKLSAGRKT